MALGNDQKERIRVAIGDNQQAADIVEAIDRADVTTEGTAEAGRALVLDSNKDVTGVRNVTLLSTGTLSLATIAPLSAETPDEHGAGAVGTGVAPATYRYTRDGIIITEILIDLTGLDSSGTENDVIGLADPGTGAAYIGQHVTATDGVLFKVEVTCLEVPLTGDADIIFVAGSAADETFDDTVADTQVIADGTSDWTLGETIVNTAPAAIAANYYYYMTQGGTDNAAYTAGQFMLRFYGRAPLS